MFIRAAIILGFLFFCFPFHVTAKNYEFSNYTAANSFTSIATPLENPVFAIVKYGSHLTFSPYTGITTHYKNVLTFLKPQTPVLVTAEDIQKRFYYAETEFAEGFIPLGSLIQIDRETYEELLHSEQGLLKKPIKIGDITLPIATKLPIIAKSRGKYKVRIITPEVKDIWLSSMVFTETVPLKKGYLKNITAVFRKKPYIWGNGENGWDCSGLLVDYFAFFNIKLPRNSFQQIQSVSRVDVTSKSLKEKERILKKAKPFLTLLYFPGHIMLYAGKKGNDFLTFQALNRLGKRKYGYVDYIPLKKGLLSRVTQIGFIDTKVQNLTMRKFEGNI